MTYHSDVVRQRFLGWVYAPLMRRMLDSMRAIVATSESYIRTSPVLSDPRIAAKVQAIPLAIVEDSYPKEGDDGVFARIGLNPDTPYFLFIGVLRYYKGLHFLVEAAARVAAPVVIAGSGPEGASLRQMARRLGARNLLLAGQVSLEEKVSLLRRARALVLPSHVRSEAFGVVLVEGAMYARPLISCEIGTGTSFVNADGETGMVIPPQNPAALASAMQRVLEDDVLASRMGLAARARYEALFSAEPLGRAYSGLYRAVARRPK
jgi:rhamnosyl/mannosyltransferase